MAEVPGATRTVDAASARAFARYAAALSLRRPGAEGARPAGLLDRIKDWFRARGKPHERSWEVQNLPAAARKASGLLTGEPLLVTDLRSQTPWWVFSQAMRDGTEVRVFVAQRPAGSWPATVVEMGAPLDIERRLALARRRAEELGLRPEEGPPVIYAWPKLGITCLSPEGALLAVDLLDLTLHRDQADAAQSVTPQPQADEPASAVTALAAEGATATPSDEQIAPLLGEAESVAFYGPTRRLPVPLITQISGQWCAAASGCMVLTFFGLPFRTRQAEVAEAMDPSNRGKYGISPPQQVSGLSAVLVRSRLPIAPTLFMPEFDPSAGKYLNLTWDDIRRHIDAAHPIMWNTVSHCAVVSGYGNAAAPNGQPLQTFWVSDPRGVEAQYFWLVAEREDWFRALVAFVRK